MEHQFRLSSFSEAKVCNTNIFLRIAQPIGRCPIIQKAGLAMSTELSGYVNVLSRKHAKKPTVHLVSLSAMDTTVILQVNSLVIV